MKVLRGLKRENSLRTTEGNTVTRREWAAQIWGGGVCGGEKKTSFLSHSKNIMFKRKARKALYRAVGMTQQATERQPRSGKRSILTGPFSPPSSQTVLWKMGKFSGQRLPTKGKESRTAWVIPVSLCGLDNLLREGFSNKTGSHNSVLTGK